MKNYTEMAKLSTLLERFRYLKVLGQVGEDTFGFNRYLNQRFYNGYLWKHQIRPKVILRDGGNEFGLDGYPIIGNIYIHHIEPITIDDIINVTPRLIDLDNLVSMSFDMHQAIHYGDEDFIKTFDVVVRTPNDTCPWRRLGG